MVTKTNQNRKKQHKYKNRYVSRGILKSKQHGTASTHEKKKRNDEIYLLLCYQMNMECI